MKVELLILTCMVLKAKKWKVNEVLSIILFIKYNLYSEKVTQFSPPQLCDWILEK